MIFNYGTVRFTLNNYIEERGISIKKLAYASEMERSQLKTYLNNEVKRVDMDVLARICCVLGCNLGDIMEYVPPEESEISH